MLEEKVDLFNPKQLAIGSLILVMGIGGSAFEGGNLPLFGYQLPAIATAAVFGIGLNGLFILIDRITGTKPSTSSVPAIVKT